MKIARGIATMVAPTRNFGMPETSAIQVAASTKKSPPLMTSARPSRNRRTMTIGLM